MPDFLTDKQRTPPKVSEMPKSISIKEAMGALGGKGLKISDEQTSEAEKQMARMEAMIYSMTPEERENPDLMNPSRKHRIAKGAGVDISQVNRMVKQFNEMKKMMKSMNKMGRGGKKGKFRLPF